MTAPWSFSIDFGSAAPSGAGRPKLHWYNPEILKQSVTPYPPPHPYTRVDSLLVFLVFLLICRIFICTDFQSRFPHPFFQPFQILKNMSEPILESFLLHFQTFPVSFSNIDFATIFDELWIRFYTICQSFFANAQNH